MANIATNILPLSRIIWLTENVWARTGRPVIVRGAPGSGKTSALLDLARRMQANDPDFGAVYFNCGGAEAPDGRGYPIASGSVISANGVPGLFLPDADAGLRGVYPVLTPDALVHPSALDAGIEPPATLDEQYQPDFLRSKLVPYSKGIVILDEFTKASSESFFATCSMLANEKRAGSWFLPSGWLVVMVCNSTAHGSHDMELPAHLINRSAVVDVAQDFDGVADYWEQSGMHPYFVEFAGTEPSMVLRDQVPLEAEPFSTARSWTYAHDDAMAFCEAVGIESNDPDRYVPEGLPVYDDADGADYVAITREFTALIAARCGEAVAVKFIDFIRHRAQAPTFDDVIADPLNALIPTHPGVQNAVVRMLATRMKMPQVEQIAAYMCREEFPRPLCAVFCALTARRFSTGLALHKGFHQIMARGGNAAAIGAML